jgi:NitT/TauT family transport system permease protein
MTNIDIKLSPPIRQEMVRTVTAPASLGDVARPLSIAEKIINNTAVRRGIIILVIAVVWEAYAQWLQNPLLFPALSQTVIALWTGFISGEIPSRLLITLETLIFGYAIGVAMAGIFATLAVTSRIGTDILSTLTSMLMPLPAIALLPLGLLWFGLGRPSMIFIMIHSVLWAVALNMHSGFLAVPETLRMAGRTFGLRGVQFVVKILIPAAMPAILAGLKIGWAFAWRTLIAAELVFGVSSGQGGLGWYIFENRNSLDTANVFAGLITVMAVGLIVESVIFRLVEQRTVRRWGMQR